jgi:hypothetical protein
MGSRLTHHSHGDQPSAKATPNPRQALGTLPVPIYITDTQPSIRRSQALREHGSLVLDAPALFTGGGQFLPHRECKMAIALRAQWPVRGIEAIAERQGQESPSWLYVDQSDPAPFVRRSASGKHCDINV